MKYKFIFSLVTVVVSAQGFASSELDSEINDLQVRIVRVQPKPAPVKVKPTAQPVTANTQPVVRKTTPVVQAPPPRVYEDVPPQRIATPLPRKNYISKQNFLRRIEIVPAFTISSFDGNDASTVIPSGVSAQYNNSFLNVAIRSDLDLGFSPVFLEVGAMYDQLGSGTGVQSSTYLNSTGNAYSEKLNLTYASIPVNLKWRLNPQETSGFFVKAGATPAFLVKHDYTSSTNLSYEYRFGAYNTFDLLVGGGLGFDFKLSKSLHAVAEVSGFQGVIPVLTNYSVYNFGIMTGVGLGYIL